MRRVKRRRLDTSALLRSGAGSRIEASLFDVSEFGCAVYVPKVRLEPDRIYSIKLQSIELLAGKVKWIRGCFAGFEFTPQLHPAVAEDLSRRFPVGGVSSNLHDDELLLAIVKEHAGGSGRPFDPSR